MHWRNNVKEDKWHTALSSYLYTLYRGIHEYAQTNIETTISSSNIKGPFLYIGDRAILLEELTSKNGKKHHCPPKGNHTFYDVFSCEVETPSSRLSLRATIRSEFWTFTCFTDFSHVGSDDVAKDPDISAIYNSILQAHSFIANRYNDKSRWQPLYQSDGGDLQSKCEESLALRISEQIKIDIEPDKYQLDEQYKNTISAYNDYVSKKLFSFIELAGGTTTKTIIADDLFGSFVGIIFGLTPVGKPSQLLFDYKPRLDLRKVGGASLRSEIKIPERVNRAGAYGDDDALHLVDAAWPVIKALQGLPPAAETSESRDATEGDAARTPRLHAGKVEFTVSRLQRNRVIYASSLGRDLESPDARPDRPVVYIMICTHANRWQLGRLIDRIHELGGLRLAAMRDFQSLFYAGDRLTKIREKLAVEVDNTTPVGEELDALEISVSGGFTHRIERSRYYIDRFRNAVKALEIQRVEGYQQYNEFVERRLSDKFSTISYVNRIHEDVIRAYRNKVNVLTQKFIRKQLEKTTELLTTAETIGFFPITYYLGHIIAAWLNGYIILGIFDIHHENYGEVCSGAYSAAAICTAISLLILKLIVHPLYKHLRNE